MRKTTIAITFAVFLIIIGMFMGIISITNRAYAVELNVTVNTLDSSISFDYSDYSEKTLTNSLAYLESLSEYATYKFAAQYISSDISNNISLATFAADDPYIYFLKDRIQFECMHNTTSIDFTDLYDKICEDVESLEAKWSEDYEADMQRQMEIRQNEFRENQITWSDYFVKMFNETKRFNWNNNKIRLKNIDIYQFFSDGEYSAPVAIPDLSMVTKNYVAGHYGIDFMPSESDPNILSIANNATVSYDESSPTILTLTLDTGLVITYENVQPSVSDGSTVNKGEVIGTYVQADSAHDGVHLAMRLNDLDYTPVWLLRKLPFITEKGMSMPLFIQFHPQWGGRSYGSGTIGGGGCGPSSCSMAISYVRDELVTPADVLNMMNGFRFYIPGVGSSYGAIEYIADKFGVGWRRIKWNEIQIELEKNHPIVACMGPGTFTSGGHYIVLSGITEDGRILVNDPADDWYARHYAKSYDVKTIQGEARAYWAFFPIEDLGAEMEEFPDSFKDRNL